MRTASTPGQVVKPGLTRHIIHTPILMPVATGFTGGPRPRPGPYRSHPHEQTSYGAPGGIPFFAAGSEPERPGPGDPFAVPAGVPHAIQVLPATARPVDTFTPVREDFLA